MCANVKLRQLYVAEPQVLMTEAMAVVVHTVIIWIKLEL